MSAFIFALLIILYVLSALLLGRYIKTSSPETARIARSLAALSLCVHAGVLASYFSRQGTFIPETSTESQLLISGILGFLALILSFRSKAFFVSMVLFMMTILFLSFSFWASSQVDPLAATAPSAELPDTAWLWVHILLALVGEACLLLGAAASIVFLIIDSRMRSRQFSSLFLARMPNLPAFDRLLGEILLIGFGFLSLGMMLGIFVANGFWQSAWWWDPKVVLCLFTWLVYALLLILRGVSPWYRGKTSAWLAIVGLLAVIFLSFGMDLLTTTRHPGSVNFSNPKDGSVIDEE